MSAIGDAIRKILVSKCAAIPDKDVAVLMSAGLDSITVAIALKLAGKSVTAYTFMLDGKLSTDFSWARDNARSMGMGFVPVFLPTDISVLKKDVIHIIRKLGRKKKTEIECTWPRMLSIPHVKQTVIATGDGADPYFALSKKAILHYKHSVKTMDEYRSKLLGDPDYAQRRTVGRIAADHGKSIFAPYGDKEIQALFMGKSWEEVNKPKQKQPLIDAFPEVKRLKFGPHTNLQLGDSGIADHFAKLLKTDWNKANHKSVVGIYNAVARGDIR